MDALDKKKTGGYNKTRIGLRDIENEIF